MATATLLPNGRQQFIDQNGNPLVSGQVFFYIPSTTTPKDTWQDQGQVTLNTNPVVLDARGQATIFGMGNYRQILKDAAGNTIWDKTIPVPDTLNIFALADIPTSDKGPIYVIGVGPMEWSGTAYAYTLAKRSGDATQTFKAAPSTAPNEVAVQSQVFGLEQTWQNMTASRTPGVAYFNTGIKPIAISIYWTNAAATQASIDVDGARADNSSNNMAGSYGTARAIVPPGKGYVFTNGTIGQWLELMA